MDTGEYRIVKTWDGEPEENPFQQGRRRERQAEAALARLEREEAEEEERQAKAREAANEPITEDRLPAVQPEPEASSLVVRFFYLPLVQVLWWLIELLGGSGPRRPRRARRAM